MIEVIKKKYPILDENGQSSTYPTFASQVFFNDGTSIEDRAFNNIMRRISFNVPCVAWTQADTGRYTQIIAFNDITSHSKCYHIDVDMSTVTEETIEDIKGAWALVDNAETVDGGIMLTCFTEAPAVDFAVIADIQEIVTDIPNANGVSF